MDNKWATIGGVLSIVSGAFGVLGGIGLASVGLFFSRFIQTVQPTYSTGPTSAQVGNLFALIYGVMGAGLALLGAFALTGGIFGVRRKQWGIALAGAICGTMAFFPTGVVAIIFTSMARQEFSSIAATATSAGPPHT